MNVVEVGSLWVNGEERMCSPQRFTSEYTNSLHLAVHSSVDWGWAEVLLTPQQQQKILGQERYTVTQASGSGAGAVGFASISGSELGRADWETGEAQPAWDDAQELFWAWCAHTPPAFLLLMGSALPTTLVQTFLCVPWGSHYRRNLSRVCPCLCLMSRRESLLCQEEDIFNFTGDTKLPPCMFVPLCERILFQIFIQTLYCLTFIFYQSALGMK